LNGSSDFGGGEGAVSLAEGGDLEGGIWGFPDGRVDGPFEGVSESRERRGGLKILPSAWCWARTGDEACALRLCLFDGMPRAEARLLAIEELTSRWGLCAAGRLCDCCL